MRIKKILKLYALILAVLIVLTGCSNENSLLGTCWEEYRSVLEDPKSSGLSLKIYYVTHDVLFYRGAVTAEELINSPGTNLIDIDNRTLLEDISLIHRLANTLWIPRTSNMSENARLCYVFEAPDRNIRFVISISGLGHGEYENYYINGISVAFDPILLDIMQTFVPYDVAQELKYYFPSAIVTQGTDRTGDGSLS